MIKYFVCLIALFTASLTFGIDQPPPLLLFGSGYWDAGHNHSEAIFEVEYRWDKYYFSHIRPQAVLIFPELRSTFIGMGLGFEVYTAKHLVFTPNITPGVYFKGSGKDLGYPIEFRSALEMTYEWDNCVRVGCQFYHISNASLGRHNPGANALMLIVAFPFLYR